MIVKPQERTDAASATPTTLPRPSLSRGLGTWDAASITANTMLGANILTGVALVPHALPHAGLVLAIWIVDGLLTLAGALTYAELGARMPRAGGQYVYLKKALGPFAG